MRLGPAFFAAALTADFGFPVFFASYRTSYSCPPATRARSCLRLAPRRRGLPTSERQPSRGDALSITRPRAPRACDRRFWNRKHRKTFQSTAWRKWRSAGRPLPDTMNLRVWDAGRPRWVSPFAGASSATQRERRSAANDLYLRGNVGGETQRQHFRRFSARCDRQRFREGKKPRPAAASQGAQFRIVHVG